MYIDCSTPKEKSLQTSVTVAVSVSSAGFRRNIVTSAKKLKAFPLRAGDICRGIKILFMIAFVIENFKAPVNLFRQNEPCKIMGKGHFGKGNFFVAHIYDFL